MKALSKKKVLNISWVGQGDFGDEVMSFVLRKYLKDYGQEKIFYYHSGDNLIYAGHDDIEHVSLHKAGTPQMIKRILDNFYLRDFDLVVIGGGSILHSSSSILWKREIINKIKKNNAKAKIIGLGVSLGPFFKNNEKEFCGLFLNKLNGVTLRDKYSTVLAKEHSINDNILDSLDSSFLLPYYFKERVFKMEAKRDKQVVALMFVWNKLWSDEFFYKNFFHKYLSIVNYITMCGKCVKLMSLYTGSAYRDKEIIDEICKKADSPGSISCHTFNGDIFDTVDALNECGYSVSMRLHGVIFSYILGIPFLSIGYDPKNLNFCNSVGYDTSACFDIINLDNVQHVLNRLENLFDKDVSIFNGCVSCTDCSMLVKNNFDEIFSLISTT